VLETSLKELIIKSWFNYRDLIFYFLIIGLKKHLKQNFKLTRLAKQKSIPIYSLNQVSFYQVSKLIQFIYL